MKSVHMQAERLLAYMREVLSNGCLKYVCVGFLVTVAKAAASGPHFFVFNMPITLHRAIGPGAESVYYRTLVVTGHNAKLT